MRETEPRSRVNREVVPGPCSWMDCLAAELLSTVVSVDTVTVFPTTVVSVDTVTVFPTTVVSVDTVTVPHNSCFCGHCDCSLQQLFLWTL